MLRMEQRIGLKQTQRLMITQRMQQAIHILQLSGLELEQYVQQELDSNPVLEIQQKEPEPASEPVENNVEDDANESFADNFDLDDYASQWDKKYREGRDLSRNPDADRRRQHYEDSITKEESFSSRLLTQLRLAAPDEATYAIGERIIGDIDERGYFTGSAENVAVELGVSPEQVAQGLALIQQFEPTGVGARDVVECLLLQVEVEYPGEDELRMLVGEHLEALEHRQIPKIARAMKVSPERVEELKAMLAKLNPWPGYEYSCAPPQYVTPDITVEKIDGRYVVYHSDERLPALHLNADYQQMAKTKTTGKEEKQYLRDKVESGKWLIRNIEQRRATILRIGQAIVEVQEGFFEKGVEALKPLTLQEIATMVGVHEATVSRGTRGKYMQSPQGLFELKFFFSTGLQSDHGEAQSSKSVQSLLKKIIDEESKAKPLSDQKIANLLADQGINIARRTVTKYREGMGILTSSLRKTYD